MKIHEDSFSISALLQNHEGGKGHMNFDHVSVQACSKKKEKKKKVI